MYANQVTGPALEVT